MDVLLQNSKTSQYLKRDLSWTPNREEAFVFISSGEAIDFSFAQKLADVHLVLFFKELQHSLIVPFQSELGQEGIPAAKAKVENMERSRGNL